MSKIYDILVGFSIGLIAAGLLFLTVRAPAGKAVELLPTPTLEPIVVYVTGAVNNPGVYRLPVASRLVDAVQQAGGFMDGADLTQVNLAALMVDGAQIVIPGVEDAPTPQLTIGGSGLLETPTPPGGELVDINSADAALLEQLPGIGATSAQSIIDYRTANGPFTQVEDLLKIPGIGSATLEEIRGLIIVQP